MISSACATLRQSAQPIHHFLVDNRVVISSSIFVALIFGFFAEGRPTHKWSSGADAWGICGLAITLIGLLIRSWAAGVLNKGRGLAVVGPFSLCRHPLYLGSSAMIVGLALLFGNLLQWALATIVLVVIYQATIRREEKRLEEHYGNDWRNFTAVTPCLIPTRFKYLPATWEWSLWMRNREYNALLATIVGLALLEWVPFV